MSDKRKAIFAAESEAIATLYRLGTLSKAEREELETLNSNTLSDRLRVALCHSIKHLAGLAETVDRQSKRISELEREVEILRLERV